MEVVNVFCNYNLVVFFLGVIFIIVIRCLYEGEDIVVQYFVVKVIENVVLIYGRYCMKFVINDMVQVKIK